MPAATRRDWRPAQKLHAASLYGSSGLGPLCLRHDFRVVTDDPIDVAYGPDQSDNPIDGGWGPDQSDAFRWCRRRRLRAIQPNLGSLIPSPGGALGSITTCPMTGMANSRTRMLAACRGRRQAHRRSLRSGRQRWRALAAHRHRQLRQIQQRCTTTQSWDDPHWIGV